MPTTTRFDLGALRRGFADHDAEAIAGLYADDAEITTVSSATPPSRPRVIRGRDEIRAHYSDVTSREMTHEIERSLVDDDSFAYQVACRYPDGTRVVALTMGELRDGLIARETVVETWDA